MRILHVIPYISPVYGGPPQVVKDMAKASILSGHEIIILSTTAGLNGQTSWKQSDYESEFISYKLFTTSLLHKWFYSKSLNMELEKLVGIIDLVHLHIPFTAPLLFASKWASRNKIPYIITTHGLLDVWSMNQKKIKKKLYYLLIEKYILKKALKIHLTSNFEKEQVSRLGLGVPLEIIPLTVNFDKRLELNLLDNSEHISSNKRKHVLFVGRLHPVKGIPYILKALHILRNRGQNVILDLAGTGDYLYVEYLKAKIKEYNLESEIVLHNFVNEEEKQVLYKRARAFIFPSLHENFGLAAAEAMLAGVPIICSDQVGLADAVSKFNAGIVVPVNNVESLANAIEKIMNIDQIKMIDTAIESLRIEYGFDLFKKRLNALYSNEI
jgi:glycosyltransferase involved in cell wall biosynthesis